VSTAVPLHIKTRHKSKFQPTKSIVMNRYTKTMTPRNLVTPRAF